MLVALSAQRHPLRFQHFVHARQARSDHRVVQRFADHARQMQPQLSPRGFLSILALGTLVHGGLLLLPHPIFRSGEECRNSNLNNLQDIADFRSASREIPMATMKAVRIHTYGGPEVLRYEDAPRPAPAAGQGLIKIHAAAVNPVDWKVRAGHLKEMLKYQLPLIPGWDAAGVVEDVSTGVTQLKQGDEV